MSNDDDRWGEFERKLMKKASRLAEFAQHGVNRVESGIDLFPDLKVERTNKVSGWIRTGSTES